MKKEIFEFIIYMIHACSKKWGQPPAIVYKKISEGNCINNYLVPNYEVLNSMGTDAVVEDIEEFIGERGSAD